MNSTPRLSHLPHEYFRGAKDSFLQDAAKGDSNGHVTRINRMRYREYDVTVNAIPFQRYAGLGVTLADVVDDLHEMWRAAVQVFCSGPEGPESDFLATWDDFSIWQDNRLVALVVCPRDMTEPLKLIEVGPFRDLEADAGVEPQGQPGSPLLRTSLTATAPDDPERAVTIQVLVIDTASEGDGQGVAPTFQDFPELQEAGWISHSSADLLAYVRIIF